MSPFEKDRFAETMFKRLYWQGYQGRFGSFRWPTRWGFDWCKASVPLQHFNGSEWNAWKSGATLRLLLNDLSAKYPGRVRLTAHSMGAIVAGEALRAPGFPVATYVAMQGAIAAHAYDGNVLPRSVFPDDQTPNRYAHYWSDANGSYFTGAQGANRYVNYFNQRDYALDKWQIGQNWKPAETAGYSFEAPNLFWRRYGFSTMQFPADTFELFAFCIEARSKALGAQASLGGGQFNPVSEVDLDTGFAFGQKSVGHSAQFRSTNMKRRGFWGRLVSDLQLSQ